MADENRLNELVDSLLSDASTMAQLRDFAAGMGLDGLLDDAVSQSSSDDTSQKTETDSKSSFSPIPDASSEAAPSFPSDMLSSLGKLAPLITELNNKDEGTQLLEALRPFLSEARAQKLAEAQRMLTILHVIEKLQKLGAI